MTRIISGKAKGKILINLAGDLVQPTSGRTKEALFSILASRQLNGAFLDLFAGSGQIGLEAASRGFSPVILVEKSRPAQQVIRKNIAATKLQTAATLICLSARQAIAMLHRQDLFFNVIFLDPPWDVAAELFADLAIPLTELLQENGVLILEHRKNVKSPEAVTGLEYSSSCKYGNAVLSFYQKVAQ